MIRTKPLFRFLSQSLSMLIVASLITTLPGLTDVAAGKSSSSTSQNANSSSNGGSNLATLLPQLVQAAQVFGSMVSSKSDVPSPAPYAPLLPKVLNSSSGELAAAVGGIAGTVAAQGPGIYAASSPNDLVGVAASDKQGLTVTQSGVIVDPNSATSEQIVRLAVEQKPEQQALVIQNEAFEDASRQAIGQVLTADNYVTQQEQQADAFNIKNDVSGLSSSNFDSLNSLLNTGAARLQATDPASKTAVAALVHEANMQLSKMDSAAQSLEKDLKAQSTHLQEAEAALNATSDLQGQLEPDPVFKQTAAQAKSMQDQIKALDAQKNGIEQSFRYLHEMQRQIAQEKQWTQQLAAGQLASGAVPNIQTRPSDVLGGSKQIAKGLGKIFGGTAMDLGTGFAAELAPKGGFAFVKDGFRDVGQGIARIFAPDIYAAHSDLATQKSNLDKATQDSNSVTQYFQGQGLTDKNTGKIVDGYRKLLTTQSMSSIVQAQNPDELAKVRQMAANRRSQLNTIISSRAAIREMAQGQSVSGSATKYSNDIKKVFNLGSTAFGNFFTTLPNGQTVISAEFANSLSFEGQLAGLVQSVMGKNFDVTGFLSNQSNRYMISQGLQAFENRQIADSNFVNAQATLANLTSGAFKAFSDSSVTASELAGAYSIFHSGIEGATSALGVPLGAFSGAYDVVRIGVGDQIYRLGDQMQNAMVNYSFMKDLIPTGLDQTLKYDGAQIVAAGDMDLSQNAFWNFGYNLGLKTRDFASNLLGLDVPNDSSDSGYQSVMSARSGQGSGTLSQLVSPITDWFHGMATDNTWFLQKYNFDQAMVDGNLSSVDKYIQPFAASALQQLQQAQYGGASNLVPKTSLEIGILQAQTEDTAALYTPHLQSLLSGFGAAADGSPLTGQMLRDAVIADPQNANLLTALQAFDAVKSNQSVILNPDDVAALSAMMGGSPLVPGLATQFLSPSTAKDFLTPVNPSGTVMLSAKEFLEIRRLVDQGWMAQDNNYAKINPMLNLPNALPYMTTSKLADAWIADSTSSSMKIAKSVVKFGDVAAEGVFMVTPMVLATGGLSAIAREAEGAVGIAAQGMLKLNQVVGLNMQWGFVQGLSQNLSNIVANPMDVTTLAQNLSSIAGTAVGMGTAGFFGKGAMAGLEEGQAAPSFASAIGREAVSLGVQTLTTFAGGNLLGSMIGDSYIGEIAGFGAAHFGIEGVTTYGKAGVEQKISITSALSSLADPNASTYEKGMAQAVLDKVDPAILRTLNDRGIVDLSPTNPLQRFGSWLSGEGFDKPATTVEDPLGTAARSAQNEKVTNSPIIDLLNTDKKALGDPTSQRQALSDYMAAKDAQQAFDDANGIPIGKQQGSFKAATQSGSLVLKSISIGPDLPQVHDDTNAQLAAIGGDKTAQTQIISKQNVAIVEAFRRNPAEALIQLGKTTDKALAEYDPANAASVESLSRAVANEQSALNAARSQRGSALAVRAGKDGAVGSVIGRDESRQSDLSTYNRLVEATKILRTEEAKGANADPLVVEYAKAQEASARAAILGRSSKPEDIIQASQLREESYNALAAASKIQADRATNSLKDAASKDQVSDPALQLKYEQDETLYRARAALEVAQRKASKENSLATFLSKPDYLKKAQADYDQADSAIAIREHNATAASAESVAERSEAMASDLVKKLSASTDPTAKTRTETIAEAAIQKRIDLLTQKAKASTDVAAAAKQAAKAVETGKGISEAETSLARAKGGARLIEKFDTNSKRIEASLQADLQRLDRAQAIKAQIAEIAEQLKKISASGETGTASGIKLLAHLKAFRESLAALNRGADAEWSGAKLEEAVAAAQSAMTDEMASALLKTSDQFMKDTSKFMEGTIGNIQARVDAQMQALDLVGEHATLVARQLGGEDNWTDSRKAEKTLSNIEDSYRKNLDDQAAAQAKKVNELTAQVLSRLDKETVVPSDVLDRMLHETGQSNWSKDPATFRNEITDWQKSALKDIETNRRTQTLVSQYHGALARGRADQAAKIMAEPADHGRNVQAYRRAQQMAGITKAGADAHRIFLYEQVLKGGKAAYDNLIRAEKAYDVAKSKGEKVTTAGKEKALAEFNKWAQGDAEEGRRLWAEKSAAEAAFKTAEKKGMPAEKLADLENKKQKTNDAFKEWNKIAMTPEGFEESWHMVFGQTPSEMSGTEAQLEMDRIASKYGGVVDPSKPGKASEEFFGKTKEEFSDLLKAHGLLKKYDSGRVGLDLDAEKASKADRSTIDTRLSKVREAILAKGTETERMMMARFLAEAAAISAFGGSGELRGAQIAMISAFGLGVNAGVEAGGGKTEVFMIDQAIHALVGGDAFRGEIIVESADAAEKYVTRDTIGTIARAFGLKLMDGSKLQSKHETGSLIAGFRDAKTVVVMDAVTRGHLMNEAVTNIPLREALQESNIVGIDEVHLQATNRTSAIIGDKQQPPQRSDVDTVQKIVNRLKELRFIKDRENGKGFVIAEGANITRDVESRTKFLSILDDVNGVENGEKTDNGIMAIVSSSDGQLALSDSLMMDLSLQHFDRADVYSVIKAIVSDKGARSSYEIITEKGLKLIAPVNEYGRTEREQISNDTKNQIAIALKEGLDTQTSVRVQKTKMQTALSSIYENTKTRLTGASATVDGLNLLLKARVGSAAVNISTSKLSLKGLEAIASSNRALLKVDVKGQSVDLDLTNREHWKPFLELVRSKSNGLNDIIFTDNNEFIEYVKENYRDLLTQQVRGKDDGVVRTLSLVIDGATSSEDVEAIASVGRDYVHSEDAAPLSGKLILVNPRSWTGTDFQLNANSWILGAEKVGDQELVQVLKRNMRPDKTRGGIRWEGSRNLVVTNQEALDSSLLTVHEIAKDVSGKDSVLSLEDVMGNKYARDLYQKYLASPDSLSIEEKIELNAFARQAVINSSAAKFAIRDALYDRMVIQPIKAALTGVGEESPLYARVSALLDQKLNGVEQRFAALTSEDYSGTKNRFSYMTDTLRNVYKEAQEIQTHLESITSKKNPRNWVDSNEGMENLRLLVAENAKKVNAFGVEVEKYAVSPKDYSKNNPVDLSLVDAETAEEFVGVVAQTSRLIISGETASSAPNARAIKSVESAWDEIGKAAKEMQRTNDGVTSRVSWGATQRVQVALQNADLSGLSQNDFRRGVFAKLMDAESNGELQSGLTRFGRSLYSSVPVASKGWSVDGALNQIGSSIGNGLRTGVAVLGQFQANSSANVSRALNNQLMLLESPVTSKPKSSFVQMPKPQVQVIGRNGAKDNAKLPKKLAATTPSVPQEYTLASAMRDMGIKTSVVLTSNEQSHLRRITRMLQDPRKQLAATKALEAAVAKMNSGKSVPEYYTSVQRALKNLAPMGTQAPNASLLTKPGMAQYSGSINGRSAVGMKLRSLTEQTAVEAMRLIQYSELSSTPFGGAPKPVEVYLQTKPTVTGSRDTLVNLQLAAAKANMKGARVYIDGGTGTSVLYGFDNGALTVLEEKDTPVFKALLGAKVQALFSSIQGWLASSWDETKGVAFDLDHLINLHTQIAEENAAIDKIYEKQFAAGQTALDPNTKRGQKAEQKDLAARQQKVAELEAQLPEEMRRLRWSAPALLAAAQNHLIQLSDEQIALLKAASQDEKTFRSAFEEFYLTAVPVDKRVELATRHGLSPESIAAIATGKPFVVRPLNVKNLNVLKAFETAWRLRSITYFFDEGDYATKLSKELALEKHMTAFQSLLEKLAQEPVFATTDFAAQRQRLQETLDAFLEGLPIDSLWARLDVGTKDGVTSQGGFEPAIKNALVDAFGLDGKAVTESIKIKATLLEQLSLAENVLGAHVLFQLPTVTEAVRQAGQELVAAHPKGVFFDFSFSTQTKVLEYQAALRKVAAGSFAGRFVYRKAFATRDQLLQLISPAVRVTVGLIGIAFGGWVMVISFLPTLLPMLWKLVQSIINSVRNQEAPERPKMAKATPYFLKPAMMWVSPLVIGVVIVGAWSLSLGLAPIPFAIAYFVGATKIATLTGILTFLAPIQASIRLVDFLLGAKTRYGEVRAAPIEPSAERLPAAFVLKSAVERNSLSDILPTVKEPTLSPLGRFNEWFSNGGWRPMTTAAGIFSIFSVAAAGATASGATVTASGATVAAGGAAGAAGIFATIVASPVLLSILSVAVVGIAVVLLVPQTHKPFVRAHNAMRDVLIAA